MKPVSGVFANLPGLLQGGWAEAWQPVGCGDRPGQASAAASSHSETGGWSGYGPVKEGRLSKGKKFANIKKEKACPLLYLSTPQMPGDFDSEKTQGKSPACLGAPVLAWLLSGELGIF